MIEIDNTLVSLDIIEENFTCDLQKCKGACCVQGNSGAPLLEEEISILEEIFPQISDYLQPEGKESIRKQGVFVVDSDDEFVTPLIEGKECAYTIFVDGGVAKCGIEKAYLEGKVNFRKPVSCHLYPVRIRRFKDYKAVNYDKWQICKPAILFGNKLKIPVYKFVKDALIRKFGAQWYQQLEIIAESYIAEKHKNDQVR